MSELVFYDSIELVDQEKWKCFYTDHPRANAFQNFEMFRFFDKLISYRPFVLFAEDNFGKCLGFCTGAVARTGKSKTKYHDKTALIYGGPLLLDDRDDLRDIFIKKLELKLRSMARYTEFRNLGNDLYLKENFVNNNWIYTPKLNYLIKLDSEEEVFSRFHKSKRQNIRKSLRTGIEVSHVKSEENIKAIFSLIKAVFIENDKKLTLPIPDHDFLIELMKLDNTGLSVVKHEDKIVAGGVFIFDDLTVYHWFRAGNRDFKHLNPDSIADWSVMKFGIQKNLKLFDFMGAGRKGWENSIRTYKSRFGGELVENGMYSKASHPFIFRVQNKIRRMINN